MPRPTSARARRRPFCRLAVQPLEDRVVPAFNLTIDGDVGVSIGIQADFSSVPGTTVVSATSTGAVLWVRDLFVFLNSGNVLITTVPTGPEAGDITWTHDSPNDDLTNTDTAVTPRTLTVRPDASAAGANFTASGVNFTFNGGVDLVIDTTAPATDGTIALTNNTSVTAARRVELRAGAANIDLDGGIGTATGDVALTGNALVAGADGGAITSVSGAVAVGAPIDLTGGDLSIRTEEGAVNLMGAVDGDHNLRMYGRTVTVAADVGASTRLRIVTFAGGDVSLGAHLIGTVGIEVGDGIVDAFEATVAGSGIWSGDVLVNPDGNLAPGGVGVVGTLTLDNGLTFSGGDYSVDLGPTSDLIVMSGLGGISIRAGSRLGDERSTGRLVGPGDVKLVDLPNNPSQLPDVFANAPAQGTTFVLGFDAVRLTHYGPAANGISVAQLPAAPNGTVVGTDADGTGYTAKLTGGGELVGLTNIGGTLELIARGTTARSRITVATRVNASDDVIALAAVRVSGPLAAFVAPRADLLGGFAATGPVGTVNLGRVSSPIRLGGPATGKTTVKAESFVSGATADTVLSTPGVLSSVTTSGSFNAGVEAAAVGAVKVDGTLSSFGLAGPLNWTVAGGIGSIVAFQVDLFTLTARNLGSLTVTGNTARRLAGNVVTSDFHLTGSDATAGRYGLKTVKVAGTVERTTFDARAGNVGTVRVGRFIDSDLFLDYTPAPLTDFKTLGFDSAAHFNLAKFTTTAEVFGDPANPLNWSFAGSRIAADTLGTVRLSGLKTDNGGVSFGIKFRTAGGSVRAAATDDPVVPPDATLTTAATALAGSFFFLDV